MFILIQSYLVFSFIHKFWHQTCLATMFKGSKFVAVVSDVRDCEWGAGEMRTAIGAVPTGKECCDCLVVCHSDPGSFLIVYS